MHRVTITSLFCPICLRGHARETRRVHSQSELINEEQRSCLKATMGVPLLDLRRPADACAKACNMACMVCGNTVAFPCESEYTEALETVEMFEEAEHEIQDEMIAGMHGLLQSLGENMLASTRKRLDRRLQSLGMAWHPRWRTICHAHCMKKLPCGCVRPAPITQCPEHPARERRMQRPAPQAPPRVTVPPQDPDPAAQPLVPSTAHATPAVISHAHWLARPSSTVAIRHPSRDTAMAPPPPKPPRRPQSKPNPRLLLAAKGCMSLDQWRNGATTLDSPTSGQGSAGPFDRARYEREFDPFLHGYVKVNGVDMFRFPDGRIELVFSGVNCITDDGHLVPG